MPKYFKNAKHLFKYLERFFFKANMLKTVFCKPDTRSTIFLSFIPLVTYKYLRLRLQVFVASLQQIPQLSHYMGYAGCGHFLLARSSLA